jgi:phosphoglycolate phosphatase
VKACVFDLDGTLVSSSEGIEWAARKAVAEVAPQLELVGFADAIGARVPVPFARCLPSASPEEVKHVGLAFRRRWYDSDGWRRSSLFPGILDTLGLLRASGVSLHIVTDKPLLPSVAILESNGVRELFRRVVSPDSPPGHADKVAALTALLTEELPDPTRTVYVGDTIEDYAAAVAAGTLFVGAAYGYGRQGLRRQEGVVLAESGADLCGFLSRALGLLD